MSNSALRILHLYTAPLSGCSARIRIAAGLKSIPLIHHPISVSTNEQSTPNYLLVNPNASVPSLVISSSSEPPSSSSPANNKYNLTITQSPAILDFLETLYPSPPLLPPAQNVQQRARVMELTSLVACDIQPPQTSRIRKKIGEFGGNGEEWARYVYDRGLQVYETFLARAREERGSGGRESDAEELVGRYSVGDEVTMADVFLVPVVQGGLRVGIELDKYPFVKSIVEECWKLEAFRKGGVGGHGRLIP